ncbi:MAG: hypothetical protein ABL995_09585 [Bryobacteraceae bacterium]
MPPIVFDCAVNEEKLTVLVVPVLLVTPLIVEADSVATALASINTCKILRMNPPVLLKIDEL